MGVGERELAEDTGLARSAYMSSESALRAELLPDDADDTDDTLLTLNDLGGQDRPESGRGSGTAVAPPPRPGAPGLPGSGPRGGAGQRV